MADQGGEGLNLETTSTWAVATVCTIFVTIGLIIVLSIEKLEHRLKEAHRKHLVHALQKMKEELMLVGIISLLLTVSQYYVASICIKTSVMEGWSPCRAEKKEQVDNSSASQGSATPTGARRRLFASDSRSITGWGDEPLHRRILVRSAAVTCKPGHSPFVSAETMHQLHTFIFMLAIVHIIYSLFAMLLASTKVNGWRVWEEDAQRQEVPGTNDGMREVVKSMSLHRQTTFIKHHTSKPWRTNVFVVWILCFFRQFGMSVRRSDYLALRLGFITTHNTRRTFDFHKYIIQSLEDEYEKVVGISAFLWGFVVLYLLFNQAGTNLFFWISFLPAVLVVVVGAKLQRVIATMALESVGLTRGGAYAGPTLKPRDELFWFHKPQLILPVIHFIFFQNAFEMASFLAYLWLFGVNSCLLRNKAFVYTRISVGVIIQVLCSYSTLPLYALVTQMGSDYKQAIFQEHVKDKLHHWRKGAKRRLRHGNRLAGETPEDSTIGCKKRSTDSDSSDEASLEPFHRGQNHSEIELGPCVVPREHSVLPLQDDSYPTLEVSIGRDNDGKTFLISESPKRAAFGRSQSVPGNAKQVVNSEKFYKQSSLVPEAFGNHSFEFQPA